MHTHWSDGSGTVADMAAAGQERGYDYIGITDHSKGLKIAGGIDEIQLSEQMREIEEVNQRIASSGGNLTVLRSSELNLNPRGEGDMQPQVLSQLDIVLGSFHSALRVKEDQTERYLAALRNPSIQVLVIQGILIMPDSSRRIGNFVAQEPDAIISRIRLNRVHCRARPRHDGRLRPHSRAGRGK